MNGMTGFWVALAVTGALFVLFAVWGWKLWNGKWLRSIAGNNFATEEDLRQPYQRSLGRRTAVVMAPCCTMARGALALSAGEAFGSAPLSTLGTVVLFASGAVVLALVVWLLAWSARQTRRQQDEAVANDPSKAEDVRLDRRAGIVLAVIVGGLIVIELVVVPLLAR